MDLKLGVQFLTAQGLGRGCGHLVAVVLVFADGRGWRCWFGWLRPDHRVTPRLPPQNPKFCVWTYLSYIW